MRSIAASFHARPTVTMFPSLPLTQHTDTPQIGRHATHITRSSTRAAQHRHHASIHPHSYGRSGVYRLWCCSHSEVRNCLLACQSSDVRAVCKPYGASRVQHCASQRCILYTTHLSVLYSYDIHIPWNDGRRGRLDSNRVPCMAISTS